jgi:signal transduction histidine kinase
MTRLTTISFGSVRLRTTLLALGVVAITLGAAAWGLLAILEHSLVSNDDNLSRARVEDLAQAAQEGSLPRLITNVGDDSMAQVVASDGRVLAASGSLSGKGPITSSLPAADELTVEEMHGVPDDSESESYRVWSRSVDTDQGRVSVFVGASLESVSETVGVLQRSLLIGVPVILAVLAAGTTLIVGRALRPVEAIRREVSSISAADLGRRVPVPANDDEVRRLAVTMNTMLERLQSSRTRQLEFVADASHELQSPITAFRAQLEIARAHQDATDWDELTSYLLADVDRMERLVRDLLYLARDDLGSVEEAGAPLDLDIVIAEEIARTLVPDGVEVNAAGLSAVPMRGDAAELARLFRNIIDNAVGYARHEVKISAEVVGDQVEVVVEDDGPGIPSDQREHVFERFVRLDNSRSRHSGGAGLGLAIAHGIALRHGGSIAVEDRAGASPGARFVVKFPAGEPQALAGQQPVRT